MTRLYFFSEEYKEVNKIDIRDYVVMLENLNFIFTGGNLMLQRNFKYKINNLTKNWFSDFMNLIIQTNKSNIFKLVIERLDKLKKT